MSVISILSRRTPSWSITLLKRSWVIGRGSWTFSNPTAMALASRMPIQIGRMFLFSRSRRMTIGDWVAGSIVIPTTCISLTTRTSFRARQGVGSGGPNEDPPERTCPDFLWSKVHDLVAGSAPAPLRGVPRARAFGKDLHLPSDAGRKAPAGVLLLKGLEAPEAPAGGVRGNGIRQGCRPCPRPGGVHEGECGIVPDLFHDGEGLLEFGFRLSRETDDEIRREGDPRPRLAHGLDLLQVFSARVSPPHGRQDPIGSRLDG